MGIPPLPWACWTQWTLWTDSTILTKKSNQRECEGKAELQCPPSWEDPIRNGRVYVGESREKDQSKTSPQQEGASTHRYPAPEPPSRSLAPGFPIFHPFEPCPVQAGCQCPSSAPLAVTHCHQAVLVLLRSLAAQGSLDPPCPRLVTAVQVWNQHPQVLGRREQWDKLLTVGTSQRGVLEFQDIQSPRPLAAKPGT